GAETMRRTPAKRDILAERVSAAVGRARSRSPQGLRRIGRRSARRRRGATPKRYREATCGFVTTAEDPMQGRKRSTATRHSTLQSIGAAPPRKEGRRFAG